MDAANGDFRLNKTAGGGALLRGAGSTKTFPGLTWNTNFDIGAAGAQVPANRGGPFQPF
jgi:hypothetical protein